MGRALSRDLRDRVVAAVEGGVLPTGCRAVWGQRPERDPLAAAGSAQRHDRTLCARRADEPRCLPHLPHLCTVAELARGDIVIMDNRRATRHRLCALPSRASAPGSSSFRPTGSTSTPSSRPSPS